jgi:hypothetical protein
MNGIAWSVDICQIGSVKIWTLYEPSNTQVLLWLFQLAGRANIAGDVGEQRI